MIGIAAGARRLSSSAPCSVTTRFSSCTITRDDLKNRGAQDRARVNVHEEHEVRYWTEKWGVTKQQLTDAVQKAGVSVDAVARELGKV
jgi:hypothetical protein